MAGPYRILILGASYGSLVATKALLAGHAVQFVCTAAEAELINREGTRVRLPLPDGNEVLEVDSRRLPGKLSAAVPTATDPSGFDLAVLAMQEPQYRAPEIRNLLSALAKAKLPCMSVMNMPPLPYLARLPSLDLPSLRHCYADPAVWDPIDPAQITLCSPDAQAFRPPEEKANVLQVGLPTNFRAARFESDRDTAILRQLQADIEAARYDTAAGPIEVPVKLKVHDSVFVPLAKWCMLITGNYRCVQQDSVRPIREAVHHDLGTSRAIYDWVSEVCRKIGARRADQVPFDKYARAAERLGKPSSAARALAAGATNIERVDMLVQTIAAQQGMQSPVVDEIVALVDAWLERNRTNQAAKA